MGAMVETVTKAKMKQLYVDELLWEVVGPIDGYLYGRTSEGMDDGLKIVRCKI